MKLNEPDLMAWVICSTTGTVESCHCSCVTGLGESCSHVAALLFYCESIEREKNDTSVTEVPAYWVKRSKKPISPKVMSEIPTCNAIAVYTKKKTCQKKSLDRHINKKKLPKKIQVAAFLHGLKPVSPDTVLLKLVPPFYKDHLQIEKFPFFFSGLYKEEYSDFSLEKLMEIGRKLEYNLTQSDIEEIEIKTRHQSHSATWRKYRMGRITASVSREVCHVKSADSNMTLIRRICYPSATQIRKKAILWGCRHEKDALAAYFQINMKHHINLKVNMIKISILIHCGPFRGVKSTVCIRA